jgi:hypothetical protein
MRGELRLLSAACPGSRNAGTSVASSSWKIMNADQAIAEWVTEGGAVGDDRAQGSGTLEDAGGPGRERAQSEEREEGRGEGPDAFTAPPAARRPGTRRLRRLPPSLGLEVQETKVLELLDAIERNIRRRPLTALACGIGAGFVIGGALSSRAGRLLLAAGARHAARELLKQLL